jgi:magnesium chelatase subunit I
MELVVSNAERRALIHGESLVVPRVGDIFAALPGITGKIELEYEGEMKGADTVIREIIRQSVANIYDSTSPTPTPSRSSSGSTSAAPSSSTTSSPRRIRLHRAQSTIQGLFEKLSPLKINSRTRPKSPSPPPSSSSKA